MNFNRLNTLTGWGVFLFALLVYLLTMAPTASFWDCGEFIACSNELEVPHPPGAPFFLLVGRLFAMLAFGNELLVAFMLNLMSVLSSAFTVLFTFWITTHLAKKMMISVKEAPTATQTLVILGAGVVAGMANTFADSFWFNAVEAEVYAMSSFFTAIVVWLMFKWEERADEPGNERWIILIAYLMGLSIGVHLLNLLTVPTLAFIYYFRKYDFSWPGFLLTGVISVGILGIIQTGIILYTFDFAWAFERFFGGIQYANGAAKSGMGLPLGTGVVAFFILLVGGLAGATIYSIRSKKLVLNTALLSVIVIYIGFSSYLMIPIRSNANPPIDENNPDNTQTFLSYMKREQYGNRPLFRGPLYNARPVALKDDGKEYVLEPGADRYTEIGVKRSYKYNSSDMKLFPRMYEKSRFNAGPFAYTRYVDDLGGTPNVADDDKPSNLDDLEYFMGYQVIHMYWRYFMWNFAGREGDVQDLGWESGLNFAKTSAMPDFMRDQPAKNHYYMLPFLLGLLGLFWQSRKRYDDATVVGLLFFFTGLAIIIYLNQYPNQPRERDYSFAGSFQTFAIWIGLGVIGLYDLLKGFLRDNAKYAAIAIGLIPPIIMGVQNWDDHSRASRYVAPDSAYNLLNSLAPNAVLFTNGDNDTFPLWYIQEVEGVREDVRVLCLSYVNTDWYIDQMKQQVNESNPLPISLKHEDYTGQANQSRTFGSRTTLDVKLPVDPQQLVSKGIIDAEDLPNVPVPMQWTVKTRGGKGNKYLELKDILIINLLENVAKGGWERPIYFANTVTPNSFIGLDRQLRQEGLAYRILPLKNSNARDPYDLFEGTLDLARMDSALTQKFRYRNLDQVGTHYDENILRMLSNYHNTFYRLANGYLAEANRLGTLTNELKTQVEAGDTEVDPSLIAANESEISRMKERALQILDFSYEKFPYEAATPDPYLLVRTGMMYERLGYPDKAQPYFDFAEERAYGTLRYFFSNGGTFRKVREYAYPLQMLRQQYAQKAAADQNYAEAMTRVTERIQELTQLNPEGMNLR
ncbi:MAG: DUF2723 domain-containing protein [Bacteroidota bacterium]